MAKGAPSRVPKASRHTAAAELMIPALRALEGLGDHVARRASASGVAILTAAGVPIDGALDPSIRIPHETAIELLELATEISGDPAFALHAGRGAHRGDFGVYQLLGSCAGTLRGSFANWSGVTRDVC